jgi:hypothetical protein
LAYLICPRHKNQCKTQWELQAKLILRVRFAWIQHKVKSKPFKSIAVSNRVRLSGSVEIPNLTTALHLQLNQFQSERLSSSWTWAKRSNCSSRSKASIEVQASGSVEISVFSPSIETFDALKSNWRTWSLSLIYPPFWKQNTLLDQSDRSTQIVLSIGPICLGLALSSSSFQRHNGMRYNVKSYLPPQKWLILKDSFKI